jgi:hypothetical protein
VIQKSRKPFYEGLLPGEQMPQAKQSLLKGSLNLFARLSKPLLKILDGLRNTAKIENVDHENTDARKTRGLSARSGVSKVKRSQSRKINVTLH